MSRALELCDRLWPSRLWPARWSLDRYRSGAVRLVALAVAGAALAWALGEVSRWAGPLRGWLEFRTGTALRLSGLPAGWGAPGAEVLWALLKAAAVVGLVALCPLFLVWWERKVSAGMQSRFGPMRTGGFHGWLQTVADGLKLLLKEDVTPAAADPWVHRLAPAVVAVPALLAFAPVPFGRQLAAADLDVGTMYVFAMAGASVLGILMAGFASGSKYSLLGGLRSAAQMVGCELPRGLSVVPVLMFAGSMDLSLIGDAQGGTWFGVVPRWFILYPVVGQLAFAIFFVSSAAWTSRVSFDLPEPELVAGFHTEYSGLKSAFFFMAEYAYVLLAACLGAAFFLGGGAPPLPALGLIPSWAWFGAKTVLLTFCFLWFRWTFPRLRADRLMDLGWKFLLPWAFANIALAGLYVLF